MRKIILSLFAILLFKCSYDEYESIRYEAPNWTSDNKIIFIEYYSYQKYRKSIFGTSDLVEQRIKVYLWEVDLNQNYSRIGKIYEGEHGFPVTNTSCAGEWIVFSIFSAPSYESPGTQEIYRVRRDGTGLEKIGEGAYPDLSPDANKLVYVKYKQGIWIMNIDGTNPHQIVPDSNATHPAWSSDGGRIAYVTDSLSIVDTTGTIMNAFGGDKTSPDWSISDTTVLMCCLKHPQKILEIHIFTEVIDTLSISGSNFVRWSPNGEYIISSDVEGFYVSRIDGTNKWCIKP